MKKLWVLVIGFMLLGVNLFAADGDLIVNGNVGIGTSNPTSFIGGRKVVHLSDTVNSAEFRVTASAADVRLGGSSAVGYIGTTNAYNLSLQTYGLTYVTIDTSGNVGIGTGSPANKLSVLQYSATDPIADSWTVYPCDRTAKEVIRTLPDQSGALDQLVKIGLYEWKRKPLVSDDEIQVTEEKLGADELERKRQELSAAKSILPKFQAKRLGVMLDDPNIPEEIIATDGSGNKGLDLVGYIGWLHVTIKELALRVQELEKR